MKKTQKSIRGLKLTKISDLFPFVPPSLVGSYYLHPPNARAIFLHNDLSCNDTNCNWGSTTYWGGGGAQTEKIQNFITEQAFLQEVSSSTLVEQKSFYICLVWPVYGRSPYFYRRFLLKHGLFVGRAQYFQKFILSFLTKKCRRMFFLLLQVPKQSCSNAKTAGQIRGNWKLSNDFRKILR